MKIPNVDTKGRNSMESLVNGEPINTRGLHFIGTPDTRELTMRIVGKVQKILDMATEKNPELYPKEEVTFDILENYRAHRNGEVCPSLKESFAGKHIYVVSDPHGDYQPYDMDELYTDFKKIRSFSDFKDFILGIKKLSINDKFIHDIFLLDTAKNNGAKTVNYVIGSLPYSRQDIKTRKKLEPSSLVLFGKLISELVDGKNGTVINLDPHNKVATANAFSEARYIDIYTGWIIREVIEKEGLENPILSATDTGGSTKVGAMAEDIGIEYLSASKMRDFDKEASEDGGNIASSDLDGGSKIRGKDVIIYDDMSDSGGTLIEIATKMLKFKPSSITIVLTHPMYAIGTVEKIDDFVKASGGIVKKVISTNSVNKDKLPEESSTICISNAVSNLVVAIHKGFSDLRPFKDDNTDYTKSADDYFDSN